MDKYRRAFKSIQEVYDNCAEQYPEHERDHYEFALRRLQGVVLVACCDMQLTNDEFNEIESWKVERRIDHGSKACE